MNQPAIAAPTKAVSPEEIAWCAWCATVERLTGHDLDGDHVDRAHDAFREGMTASDYALQLQAKTSPALV